MALTEKIGRTIRKAGLAVALLGLTAGCGTIDFNAGNDQPQQQGQGIDGGPIILGAIAPFLRNQKLNGGVQNAAALWNQQASRENVNVYVQQYQQPQNAPNARINRVWEDHNVFVNGEKGMMIHTSFDVYNVQGNVNAIVYFFDRDGIKLMDRDGIDRAGDGQVSVVGETTSPAYFNDTNYSDYRIFVPYSQFDITDIGKHELKFCVGIHNKNSNQFIAISNFQDIWYNKE